MNNSFVTRVQNLCLSLKVLFLSYWHSFDMEGIFDLKQEKVSKTVPSARNLREVLHLSGRR